MLVGGCMVFDKVSDSIRRRKMRRPTSRTIGKYKPITESIIVSSDLIALNNQIIEQGGKRMIHLLQELTASKLVLDEEDFACITKAFDSSFF